MSNKLILKEFMHMIKEFEKKSSTSQEEKPKNLKANIKGGYPEENVRLVEKEMDAQGFTNPFIRIAILSVCAKERGLKTDPEISYKNTSSSNIKGIFGSRFESVEDEKIDKLKKSTKDFFNYVYGGELPDDLKDGWPEKALDAAKKRADVLGNLEGSKGGQKGDGYRYRGMGFNQLTGRYAYRKRGKAIGEDLESNPDRILDPTISSKVAVGFIKKMMERKDGRMKFEGDDWQNGYTNQEDANIAAAGANAGWKTSIEKAVNLTKSKNKGFSYDDMPTEKKSEENKSKEDSSKKESNISDHIKNKKEGNEFREWVNDNHEDYAKETKLDRSGNYKNNYIKDAWEKFGDEYLEFKKKNTFDEDKVEVLGQMEPYPKGGLDFNYVKIRQGDDKGKNIVYAISTKDNSIYARSGGSKSSYEKLSEALLKEVKIGDHNISKKYFFTNVFSRKEIQEPIEKINDKVYKELENEFGNIKKEDPTSSSSPGYYDITFGSDGNPSVPAIDEFAKAIKDELGVTVTSKGRGPSSQSRVSFQYPYAIDALVRKFDPSLPAGIYYFSNHPKSGELWPKVQKALEKIPGMNKSKISTTKKGVYSAYDTEPYKSIFNEYEKGKDFIQNAGVKGDQLQSAKGKEAGKEFWSKAEPFWTEINKKKAKTKETGHATGYGLDVSERVPKEKLQKVADRFGLTIKDVKYESDHNHVNIVNKSTKVNESLDYLKEFIKMLKSS